MIPATRASITAFFDELRIGGFVEGQNLEVTGSYSVPAEQIADSVAALMKTAPEVILSGPETYLRALQAATRTIPLDSMSEDLVGEGFAASLAKPGGNITGVSLLSPELDGKRLEILIEAVPGVRRIAALAHSHRHRDIWRSSRRRWRTLRRRAFGVLFRQGRREIAPALDSEARRAAHRRSIFWRRHTRSSAAT